MKLKLIGSASALAVALAFTSAASAQSLSDTIGTGLIDLQSQFADGNLINQAINTGAIDASVNIDAAHVVTDNLYVEGSLGLDVGLAASLEGSLADPAAAAQLALEANLGLDLWLVYNQTQEVVGGIINSTEEIKTVAAGAINTGDIASSIASAETGGEISLALNVNDLNYINGELASAAASTSNTSAESLVANGTVFQLGGLGVELGGSFYQNASGPLTDIYAVNQAFNNADINGSVNLNGLGTNLAGISTTAAGALNTGTISFGFDGSALSGD